MLSAKEVWTSLYTNDLESIWKSERGALRKPAMLYYVLKQELQKLQEGLGDDIKRFENQILSMEDGTSKTGRENVDMSLSENELSKSPTINKQRNISFTKKIPKLLLLKNENLDVGIVKSSTEAKKALFTPTSVGGNADRAKLSSIIKNIPVQSFIKKTNQTVVKRNQRKQDKSSTHTQLFKFKSTTNPISNKTKLLNLPLSSCKKLETKSRAVGANETFGAVKMETSTILKDVKNKFKDYDKFPIVRPKSPLYVHKTEPVRRKADRMKLPGWSCENCQKFYESSNLSPEELRKRMNACSKHRSKFEPLNETFEGFWDVKMFPTQDEDN